MSYAPMRSNMLNDKDYIYESTPVLPNARLTRTSSNKPLRARKLGKSRVKPFNRDSFPIIVHCHLCWDWVWQRPQQFLSRLSIKHPVLFIETLGPDPSLAAPLARWRKLEAPLNITILQLQFPTWRWGDGDYVDQERRRLVQEFMEGPVKGQFDGAVQWFYDPMAVTAFGGQMGEVLNVYDCMDELSKFKGAPPNILERERELLDLADVVFTGGARLYDSKSQHNENCHFYGCGVDCEHFGKARLESTLPPPDVAALKQPVLGYFGVVDERMDYELVAKLADANPEWNVAILGPVMKVDPASLPQRPNLHWMGHKAYTDLPACCKGFSVCLMPFAMNESTEFINPTKALEYMATGRPIVSTPVPDVVRNFGSVVKIGASHEEFIALCHSALREPDSGSVERGLEMAHANTWESIVARLEQHVCDAARKVKVTA